MNAKATRTPSADHVPLRERLFRECEAMLAYATGEGAITEKISDSLLNLLDRDEAERAGIRLDEIVKLHDALAREIAPALPRTVEQMHWDRRQPGFWRRVAPLNSLRNLIIASVALGGLFLVGTLVMALWACEGLACNNQGIYLVWLYVFFGILGGLGATFSALYDSYNFLREGCYDDRLASTYVIRIGIGVFSGVLLAYFALEGFFDAESVEPIAPGLIAFVGGFAAQLVYDLLNRLVDSIANMFRPDRRRERAALEREFAVGARERASESQARQRVLVESVLTKAEKIDEPARRDAWTRQALAVALSGATMDELPPLPSGGEEPSGTELTARVEHAKAQLAESEELLSLLPEDRAETLAGAVQDARDELGRAAAALAAGATSGSRGEVDRALAAAASADPMPVLVARALADLRKSVGRAATQLSLATLEAGQQLGPDAYRRWKVAAFGAPAWSAADLAASADARRFSDAAAEAPAIRRLLATEGGAERLRALLRSGDRAALEATLADGGSASGLAPQIDAWLGAVLRAGLERELSDEVIDHVDGLDTVGQLLSALDKAREDEASEAGLHLLGLIAERVRRGGLSPGIVKALIFAAGAN